MRRGAHKRVPNWAIGVVAVVLIAIGSILAWTKELPFGDPYEVRAVFTTAQNIRTGTPVRIAGIEVGEVTGTEHLGSGASEISAEAGGEGAGGEGASTTEAVAVTMEIDDSGLPLHSDATLKLRPRLFLEGNLFVELEPGSPNAAEAEDGFTFPIEQTSVSVQLDEILTTLQSDVREDLQTLLDQLGNALVKHGGAEGFRELYRTSAPAFKFTSQVNEALLGTRPGDLRGTIRGISRVVRGLGRNEVALADLVTNFRIVTGSFARESEALGRAVEELPRVIDASRPAFANLNDLFPTLRAFALEALPGVRTTPETIDVATPFIEQVRGLVSEDELRGLVDDLRPTVGPLAGLTRETISFLRQSRALSSCFNEVVIPWANDTVDPQGDYPHEPTGRVFETTGYGLSGISGENRSGDANAQYLRVLGGGGTNTITIPNALPDADGTGLQDAVGLLPFPLLGAMPRVNDSAKTPFRPDVRCETQEPPDLGAGGLGEDEFPFEQQTVSSLQEATFDPDRLTPGQRRLDRGLKRISGQLEQAGGENAPPKALTRMQRGLQNLLTPDTETTNRPADQGGGR